MTADPTPPSRAPAGGEPTYKSDPTANVIALTEAAVKRLDDLAELRDLHQSAMGALRAEYEEKLRVAEAARLDAIRQVDAESVRRAADDANTRANTLQATVVATANAFELKIASVIGPLDTKVSELQKALYEQQGGKAQGSSIQTLVASIVGLLVLALLAYGAFRDPATPAPIIIEQPAVTTSDQ